MIAARQIFLGRGGAKLPYDAEVEYLESTGTQFIDTGLNADSSLGYDITSSITNYNQSYDQPFGVLHRNPIIRHHFGNITSANPHVLAILLGDGTNFIVQKSEGTSGEIVRWMVDTVNRTASIDNLSGSWGSVSAFDTGLTFYLFGRHDSSSDRLISARCYSARFYVNGVLVRDYIPVRVGTTGELYDRVSGKFAERHGDFLYGDDVVEVEYLQGNNASAGSTINCVIDTGIVPNIDTDVWVCDAQFVRFGDTAGDWGAAGNRFAFGRGSASWNDWYFGFGNTNNRTSAPYDLNRHTFRLDGTNKTLTVDSNVYSGSGSVVSGVGYTVAIFNRNNENGITYTVDKADSRCYSAKYYRNGVLIQDLIPVRVGTEGSMKDALTRRFYRNGGTGNFSYGADKA